MSIYNSSAPLNCPGDQSPINLSYSSAKPCDLLCDIVIDNAMVSQANVIVSDEGLMLQSTTSLGSCKYNGEGYMCNALVINHPSHHTIENIQADGEVIAVFTNPTGKYLCVSSLFRVNSAQTPSSHFFNSFIPYANASQQYTQVNLGDNWSLSMMVPPNKAHFVYDGSMPWNCTQYSKWVVYKSMINIDSNVFAFLVKTVSPGSRPVQPLGSREVFYNDPEVVKGGGGAIEAGGDKYMRFKLVGNIKSRVNPVQSTALKENANKNNKNIADRIIESVGGGLQTNGVMYYVSIVLTIFSIGIGIYAGLNMYFIGTYILDFSQNVPGSIYNLFWYVVTFWYRWITYFIGVLYDLKTTILSTLTKKPEQAV
jgi:carbonic anhydrase